MGVASVEVEGKVCEEVKKECIGRQFPDLSYFYFHLKKKDLRVSSDRIDFDLLEGEDPGGMSPPGSFQSSSSEAIPTSDVCTEAMGN